jgi:Rrf2 family protein
MIRLARHPKGEALALIPQIARAEGISAGLLARAFQKMARAGLVETQRGAAGGVSLGRPADEISLRDIVEAVEGPVELNRCLSLRNPCANAKLCPLSAVWREAQEKMLEVLGKVTLAQVNAPATGA